MKRLLCAVAVLLGCTALPAEELLYLDWDYSDASYLEVTQKSKREITVLGKTTNEEISIRFVFKVKPIKVTRTNSTLELTVLESEDVTKKVGQPDEVGDFEGLKDQKFQVKLGPRNQTLQFTGLDAIIEPVFGDEAKNGNENDRKFMANVLNAVMQTHLGDAFLPAPDKPAKIRDSWKHTTRMSIASVGEMAVERTFTRLEPQIYQWEVVDAIGWKSTVEIGPSKENAIPLPFKVKAFKEKEKATYEGTALWNPKKNHPIRIDTLQRYHFDFDIETNGQSLTATGKGVDGITIKFSEERPK